MISKLPKWVWTGGGILAFSAGIINAIALLGFAHQGATHVTGNFSRFSIAISHHDTSNAMQILTALLSFFSGAILSGIIVRDGHLKMGRRYGVALGIESALLFASVFAFSRNPVWGEYLAGMAAGLQNGLVSTYSGAIVRTTHLTGLVTDLGVLIGHYLRGLPVDSKRIKLFLILIGSFTGGGIMGSFLFSKMQNNAMIFPAFLIGLTAAGYMIIRHFYSPKN